MNQTAIEVDNESLASRAEDALQQLLYSAHAFAAVAVPVSISMILSSLAIVFINDGLNGVSSGGTGIPVIFEESGDDSTDERFVSALVNALAIIGAIIGATFLMVLLYYFKFMKTLFAWLICSTALLLAFSTGLVVQTVVGVTAVFFQKGIPPIVTGGYLIAISVTMAWILIRYLPEWTSWALLALLAFYDLCAVLTPCGPLKWLVGIMQERDEPLPGLLYEARVRTAGAAGGQTEESPYVANVNNTNGINGASNASVSTSTSRRSNQRGAFSDVEAGYMIQEESLAPPVKPPKSARLSAAVTALNNNSSSSSASAVGDEVVVSQRASSPNVTTERSGQTSSVDVEDVTVVRGSGASAVAASSNVAISGGTHPVVSGVESPASNGTSTLNETRQEQARSNGQQQRPVSTNNANTNNNNQPISGEDDFLAQLGVGDDEDDRSIKLGLGDFVFYSVLCARAALVSFTTFVAVFVVVLFGLAMTLVLLAVYRTALPALPISILLGLVFFFAVDAVVVPFVNNFAFEMAFT